MTTIETAKEQAFSNYSIRLHLVGENNDNNELPFKHGFEHGAVYGFETGVKHTKQEYEDKLNWIPVESDTLPDDNILVEVKNEEWETPIKIARLQKRMWIHPDLNCFLSPIPTHWRHIFL